MKTSTGGATTGLPRILFLDHVGELGGAELSLLDIATHFAANGRVLLYADGPFRRRLEEAGVAVDVLADAGGLQSVRRQGGVLQNLMAVPDVARTVRAVARASNGVDLLYANSQKAFIIGALSTVFTRKPMIWHVRDILTADHFSKINKTVAVLIANTLVDRVIANSGATRQAFIDSGGSPKKSVVVHNGINDKPFRGQSPERVAALRNEFALADGPIVGLFSRISDWKGQHVLLDALARCKDVQALIVGAPLFPEDDRYQAQIHQQCRELGLEARVRFVGNRRDVPDLMKLCDIVVHTSTAPEPFGRVIVEAMLAGRPVVASAAGGVLEILEAEKTGLLVPPGDAAALAAALIRLGSEDGLAARLAAAGEQAATERFTLRSMLGVLERHVQDTVAARR